MGPCATTGGDPRFELVLELFVELCLPWLERREDERRLELKRLNFDQMEAWFVISELADESEDVSECWECRESAFCRPWPNRETVSMSRPLLRIRRI
jgi:hypothetical protein